MQLYKGTPNQTQPAGNPIQIQQGVPTKFSLGFAYWYTGLVTWSVTPQVAGEQIQITANVADPIQLSGGVGTNDQIIPDGVTMLATAPVGTYLPLYTSAYQADGSGGSGSVQLLVIAPPSQNVTAPVTAITVTKVGDIDSTHEDVLVSITTGAGSGTQPDIQFPIDGFALSSITRTPNTTITFHLSNLKDGVLRTYCADTVCTSYRTGTNACTGMITVV
jgi:hypothetical protein